MADVDIDTEPDSPLENGCAAAWSSATCRRTWLTSWPATSCGSEARPDLGRAGREPAFWPRFLRAGSRGLPSRAGLVSCRPASLLRCDRGVWTRGVASTPWR